MSGSKSIEEQIVSLLSKNYEIEVITDEDLGFNEPRTLTLKFNNDFDIDLIKLEVKTLPITVFNYSKIVIFRYN